MMSLSSNAQQPFTLIPVNLRDPTEIEELQRQRFLCGWHYEKEHIEKWRDLIDQKLKNLFWISLGRVHHARAGHISLDSYADPPDPELATSDKSVMTIQTFFVLPECRALGLGERAMDTLEDWATREPYGSSGCKVIAVNTLSKHYVEDTSPEWRGVWAGLGMEPPKWSVEDWYVRRGYVKWKEEVRYHQKTPEGQLVSLVASFLRKTL